MTSVDKVLNLIDISENGKLDDYHEQTLNNVIASMKDGLSESELRYVSRQQVELYGR